MDHAGILETSVVRVLKHQPWKVGWVVPRR